MNDSPIKLYIRISRMRPVLSPTSQLMASPRASPIITQSNSSRKAVSHVHLSSSRQFCWLKDFISTGNKRMRDILFYHTFIQMPSSLSTSSPRLQYITLICQVSIFFSSYFMTYLQSSLIGNGKKK